ncbi:MAG TPA: hypothetical protein PLV03_02470 [Clostridiales bacterium]|nr:hypothetical protein [Clostridiales bacterium]
MTQDKINQAWSMYQEGATYQTIAKQLGYSTSWIGYVISRNVKRMKKRGAPFGNKNGQRKEMQYADNESKENRTI